MSTPLSPEEIDHLARRRAGAKMGWYIHATLYVLVNLLWLAMSGYGIGQRHWTPYPVIGWGIGLAFHGISVFVLGKGSSLRERMVDRERARLERRQQERRW
jgi:hypothetical protein